MSPVLLALNQSTSYMLSENSLLDILTFFFYERGYLSIPELGRFVLEDKAIDFSQPEEINFDQIPEGAISFQRNTKEKMDPELIGFITKHTRKMKPLAEADLVTLSDQVRQMLNVYQPMKFPGIGSLLKKTDRELSFKPGVYWREEWISFQNKGVEAAVSTRKPHSRQSSPSFSSMGNRKRVSTGGWILLVILLILVALLYFIFSRPAVKKKLNEVTSSFSLFSKDSTESEENIELEEPAAPSTSGSGIPEQMPDVPEGMIYYEVVFETASRNRAEFRDSELTSWGHTVIVETQDSLTYTLAEPFTTRPEDTTRVKDSLSIFFGRPTTIRYPASK